MVKISKLKIFKNITFSKSQLVLNLKEFVIKLLRIKSMFLNRQDTKTNLALKE